MFAGSTTTDQYELKARADRLKLLYRQSFPAVAISAITASIMTAVLWAHVNPDLLTSWLALFLFSSGIRLTLFIRYFRHQPDDSSLLDWEKPYIITQLFSSIIWGIGSLWIMISTPSFLWPIVYFFQVGMAGGAVSVYSANRFVMLSSIVIVLLPSTIWLLLQQNTVPLLLGLGGTLFLFSTIRASKIISNALHRAFLLTHQLTEAKEAAERLAKTDILTGLNNRGSFNSLANAQNKYCQRYQLPVSVILLDVDKFKEINDTRGHHAGDLALKHLANVLQNSTRESDICGRIGGEEFAILLPNTDAKNAGVMAEKIRTAVASQAVKSSDGDFKITASFGVATGNHEIEQLIKNADTAMYRVKESGRNQVHHFDE